MASYIWLFLMQLRHVDKEDGKWKALPKLPRDAGQPWAHVYTGPKHVVFGHHARRRLQVTCLDIAMCSVGMLLGSLDPCDKVK